ncbi:T9SS type B sorting domain-containing protein [Parapedobacter koreensis]|uniref:Gliding motility-associated C-terminal domain-containing protein n=1 Tax=Parapedobacter koreensis TaxID=332977 RepID=A0A1H7QMV2_9SPHI|nr:gliding motility-associated C-terminal domain-containing protein [Parapedobacter koreensis]SEL49400.1 gliding motility-associated C-terminal domain-containing protein [Parapedobacter koreensis]
MTRQAQISIRKVIVSLLWLLTVLLAASPSLAQTGAGSTTADNSTVVIDPETVELRYAETSYFGPNSHWIINGTLEIWSRNIWIAPTASFSGTGKIIIHDPGTNPFYEDMTTGPTRIDGNHGEPIAVPIELRNPNNLILTDIADPGYDTDNADGPQAAALHINSRFDFAIDGGDVLLNGHDLLIGAEGSLRDYSRERMIVTNNSVAGHVVKTYASANPFTFPIGIAEGDYTPATLSPANASATLHVSVRDYRIDPSRIPQPEIGMDRMWHIYADEAVYTAYTLQHNSVTNGSAYVDARAQLMQYAGSGNWMGGNTQRLAQGIHARDWVAAAHPTADDSWLTKLVSDSRGPEAVDDAMAGPSGIRLTVVVLENDRPGDSPLEVASVRVVVQPRNGVVLVNTDGSITYTSNLYFVGEDDFVYEVTDENGQRDIATVRMTITYAELLIPNALTPNGDGKNDLFVIQGLENYEAADLTIFNRWGNEVYRSRSYQQNWGAAGVSDGTYYYRLVLRKDGVETIHKGWVLVKRQ